MVWKIAVLVVLLLIWLLLLPVTAYIEYNNNFTVKVKYLFFTFFPTKPKKTEKTKKPKKSKKSAKKRKKPSIESITQSYKNAKAPVKRLIKKTRVTGFRLNFVIGGEDAAAIALNYGLQTALVNGLLAWLKEAVILEIKEVRIKADFTREESERRFKCRVKLSVFTAIVCLLQYIGASAKNI